MCGPTNLDEVRAKLRASHCQSQGERQREHANNQKQSHKGYSSLNVILLLQYPYTLYSSIVQQQSGVYFYI
jgi:hypothetical protein